MVYVVSVRIENVDEVNETIHVFKSVESVYHFCVKQSDNWKHHGFNVPILETTNFIKDCDSNAMQSILTFGDYIQDGYTFEISVSKCEVEE